MSLRRTDPFGRARAVGGGKTPRRELALDPLGERRLGITSVRGGAGQRRFNPRVQLPQHGQDLVTHAHPRMPMIGIGGVVAKRQRQVLRELAGRRPIEVQERAQPTTVAAPLVGKRIKARHRRQAIEARAAREVEEHRLGLIGGCVSQRDKRGAVRSRLLPQRLPSLISCPCREPGPTVQAKPRARERQPKTLRQRFHLRRLFVGLRPQAMVHMAHGEPKPLAARQTVQHTEEGNRVGAPRARHMDRAGQTRLITPRKGAEAAADKAEGVGDSGMVRWHGGPPCDSTSRAVVPPQTPDTLNAEDLRSIDDDPLALEQRDDGHVLVPALPPTTFVRIARKLRDENRLELLLPLATPYQLTSLLDLDGWVTDRVDIRRARVWLHAIAVHAVADEARGALRDLMFEMDPELWTVAMAAGTVVVEVPHDEDDARGIIMDRMGSLRTWESPDGYFVVGVPDDELGRRTLHTITLIYEDDLDQGRQLLLSIQSLVPAEAEENLMRFRDGRLADLGFVEWEQAMMLLQPLDRRIAARHEPIDFAHLDEADEVEPSVAWRGPQLLRTVMQQLPPDQHGLRSREFLLLVAEVMSAQRFDPGDEALQQRAIDQTQSTVSLGLELLGRETPRDTEVGTFLAERVASIGLRLVFRVGYGALDKLRRAAIALHRRGHVSLEHPGSLLDRPWGPTIATLVGQYPELPLHNAKGTRPLRSLQDVAEATVLITQAGALAQLCFAPQGYGIDPIWLDRVDEAGRLTLGDLVRTAVVHAQLPGSQHAMAPLSPADLAWAAEHLLVKGGLADTVAHDLSKRCADLGIAEHEAALVKNLLTRLQVELSGLELDPAGAVDMRRVSGLITVQHVSIWLSTRHGAPN